MDNTNENSTTSKSQLELLSERITYSENVFGSLKKYEIALKRLLDDSKYIALSIRYPYKDYADMELPKKYFNWQLRCCEQIYQAIGTMGIKSYAENGLSWTRDSSYLPYDLLNEIEPMVGYIKETEQ